MSVPIEKGPAVDEAVIRKYESVLPKELIEIWREYGYGTVLDGYLTFINPDEYQDFLNQTYFAVGEIPIMATAFGDILTVSKENFIHIVKYKNIDFNTVATDFKFLFSRVLGSQFFLNEFLKFQNTLKLLSAGGNWSGGNASAMFRFWHWAARNRWKIWTSAT